jgi:signal transduction histidine kinase
MIDPLDHDVAAVSRISAVPTILRTMRALTGLRFTLVARVTPERWVACAVHDEINFGLNAGEELDVTTTLCAEVRDSQRPIFIDHASADPVYCTHRTPKMYAFESYVAIPIFRRSGEYFGNLCGFDPLPLHLNDGKTRSVLELFSELIAVQLEAEEKYEGSRAELDAQRKVSKLREQFIAVLGHDVRNPLSSIVAGTDLVLRRVKDADDRRVLERVRSSSRRITALVDDLLDLARGRLGGGIVLDIATAKDIAERLQHVIAEVQAAHPDRAIHLEFDAPSPLRCDIKRVEQLLSNLLANAVQHGSARTPINVSVEKNDGAFTLKVTNEGPPVPEDKLPHLFEPYFRGQGGTANGLGLGLYIVSEIAKAHGGKVAVASCDGRTSFTFTMRAP